MFLGRCFGVLFCRERVSTGDDGAEDAGVEGVIVKPALDDTGCACSIPRVRTMA